MRLVLGLAVLLTIEACSLLADTSGLSGGVEPIDPAIPDATSIDVVDAGSDAPLVNAPVDVDSAYAKAVLVDQPVLYYRLGETTGTVARDALGLHNGRYSRSVVLGAASLVAGEADTALGLPGGESVSFAAFDGLFAGRSPYTIEAWISVTRDLPTVQWILGRESTPQPRFGSSFIVSDATVALELWIAGTGRRSALPVTFGRPVHAVGTFDGTTVQVWVDGVAGPAQAIATGSVPDTVGTIGVGAQSSLGSGFLTGAIDEVALYNRALPSDRIKAHYVLGKPR